MSVINEILQRIDDFAKQNKEFSSYGIQNILKTIVIELGGVSDSRIDELEAKFDENGVIKIDYLPTDIVFNSIQLGGTDTWHNPIISSTQTSNGGTIDLGEVTSELWESIIGTIRYKWDINIGNAGGNTPIWQLTTTSVNSSNHIADVTEWRFNHYIDIPAQWNGNTDSLGQYISGSIRFIADDVNDVTSYLGFLNSAKNNGVLLWYRQSLNYLYIDGAMGSNIGVVLNNLIHTKFSIFQQNYANEVASIDANGKIDAQSYSVAGTSGASGTFTTADGKTVTVTNGIITSIV